MPRHTNPILKNENKSGNPVGLEDFLSPGLLYPPQTFPEAWAQIDTAAIVHNIREIRTYTQNKPLMPVIKNNAYGHGIVPVGKVLEKTGVAGLCVGKLAEAVQLIDGGIQCPVLNFGPFGKADAAWIVDNHLHQSVFHDNILLLNEAAEKKKKKALVHIKIDTGLGRVGIPYGHALEFIETAAQLPHLKIMGIFSALTEDDEFDQVQLGRFTEVCVKAAQKGIDIGARHLASSAAVISSSQTHLDLVRPGIMTFGYYPSLHEYRQRRIDLRPAFSLKARVSFVKRLAPGESVSYHKAFTARRDTDIATIAIGYSDGWFLKDTGPAHVGINGKRYPVVGIITSNHLSVDLGTDHDVKPYDIAEIFGPKAEAAPVLEEIAANENSSEYKLLSGINPNLPRFYK